MLVAGPGSHPRGTRPVSRARPGLLGGLCGGGAVVAAAAAAPAPLATPRGSGSRRAPGAGLPGAGGATYTVWAAAAAASGPPPRGGRAGGSAHAAAPVLVAVGGGHRCGRSLRRRPGGCHRESAWLMRTYELLMSVLLSVERVQNVLRAPKRGWRATLAPLSGAGFLVS